MSQVPTAGYDSIFYSHHSMVDRLWYIWQNSANAQNPPPALMNTEGLDMKPVTLVPISQNPRRKDRCLTPNLFNPDFSRVAYCGNP